MLISEVARRSGVSVRMLRHYDALGLVSPDTRTSSSYRDYSEADVRRLFHVESLRAFGLSLGEVKKALDDPTFSPPTLMDRLVSKTRERIAADNELLANLTRLQSAAPADWDDALRIIALLRAIESDSGYHRQRAALSRDDKVALPAETLAEKLLAEDELNVAGALRWALAQSGGGIPTLSRGLESSDPLVRRRAVVALAELDDPAATSLLLQVLDDPDVDVRDRAALAVAARGRREPVAALAQMVAEGRRDVEASERLGELADVGMPAEEIVTALRQAVDDVSNDATRGREARLRMAQALAEIDGDSARTALTTLAGDEDRTVAATAAVVLHQR